MRGPRILATDGQERAVLAAIRCLGDAGFSVAAASSTALAPGLWSRRCAERLQLPDAAVDPIAFVDALAEAVRSDPPEMILAGTDVSLYALSEHRDRVGGGLRGLPPAAIVRAAFDKDALVTEAERCGIGPPKSHVCPDRATAVAAARALGYPVVVKATRAVVGTPDGRFARPPTIVAADEPALVGAQESLGRCIVQRRVAGRIVSYAAVATDDGLRGAVVSRYVRTWPPAAGSVSFSETIAAPQELHGQVAALIGALGWRGIFELELIERPDGGLGAIDLNPRPYGSMALAIAAGSPLPAIWCCEVLGRPAPEAESRVGVRYRWEDADVRSLLAEARAGRRGAAMAALRPRRGVTHAYFQRRDPLPGVTRLAQMSRHVLAGRGS